MNGLQGKIDQDMAIKDNTIHVALAANHAYSMGMEATLASMLMFCSDKSRLQFHLLDDGLSDDDRGRLRSLAQRLGGVRALDFLKPDLSGFARNHEWCGSHTAYARLLLCELLPDVDWIIYADVDTLWFADICEFWDLRDDSVSIVWCRDTDTTISIVRRPYREWGVDLDESRYCCSAVAMMNLAKMRCESFAERSAEFLRAHVRLPFADQDVLNVLLMHDSIIADQRWDAMNPTRTALAGAVIHCSGVGHLWKRGETRPRRPVWYIWYRFYANVVEGDPSKRIPSWVDRVGYWLISIYPNRIISWLALRTLGLTRKDQLVRQMFFCWLIRSDPWWRRVTSTNIPVRTI